MAAYAACGHSPPLISVMPRQPKRFLSNVGKPTDRQVLRNLRRSGLLLMTDKSWRRRSHARVVFQMEAIMLGTILLVILILLLIGALPTWPYSAGWGYYPSSGLGLVVIIILILLLLGRI
jgi:Protein of unknown function (DUF3309)